MTLKGLERSSQQTAFHVKERLSKVCEHKEKATSNFNNTTINVCFGQTFMHFCNLKKMILIIQK